MNHEKELWPGWKTVRIIGQGSFGAVYEIERTMLGISEKAALKVITIPQSDGDIRELLNDGYDEETVTCTFKDYLVSIVSEYNLMRKLNGSSNIVSCDDYRYVQHDDGFGWDIFIKMELLTPLAEALPKEIPEEMALRIGIDICKALVLCAKYDIIHRDIKPQNIFVSPNGDYKLGDFGIAKTVEKTSSGTKVGTYKYMAPEVYNNQPYGASADIYSLGLVMYWLLNEKRLPFLPLTGRLNPKVDEEARTRRLQGEALPAPVHGSKELKQIVLKACAYDPKERYHTAEEMLKDLRHVNDPITVPDPVPVFPEKQKLTDYFQEASLAEQYVRETASTSVFVPVQENGFWRCTCGEIHSNSEDVCRHCKLDKKSVFALFDVNHLAERYAAYTEQLKLAEENKQKEGEDQERIEQEKQLELARQQIHQERIKRGQELAQKKEREAVERVAKRERKWYYAIIAICIGIFLAVAWVVSWTQRNQAVYEYAYSDDPSDHSQYSAEEFAQIVNSENVRDILPLGTKIKIIPNSSEITDESIEFELVAYKHFRLANRSDMAKTTWLAVGVLEEERQMFDNWDVDGYEWKTSGLRSWLNDTLYPTLPNYWKNLMVPIQVVGSDGFKHGNTSISEDYLYIPSLAEVDLLSNSESFRDEYYLEVDSDAEEKTFSVFTDSASRIKEREWWLRSPLWGNPNYYFSTVNSYGNTGFNDFFRSKAVCLGFCLGGNNEMVEAETMPNHSPVVMREMEYVYQRDENICFWGQNRYTRSEVQSITFQKTLSDVPNDAWDVSDNQDQSVMAWMENGNLTVAANGVIQPNPNAHRLFSYFVNLKTLDLANFDTSNVYTMFGMFEGCESLEELDVSNFVTTNVADMGCMFRFCYKLPNIDISNFVTSNVEDMSSMFEGCKSLTNLDLSNFITSNVTNMSSMFEDCGSLTNLDLSNFDTSKVGYFTHMFKNCKNLTKLSLTGFDSTNAVYTLEMFAGSKTLNDLQCDDQRILSEYQNR